MPAIVKIPETEEEYNAIITYLQSKILPPEIKNNLKRSQTLLGAVKSSNLIMIKSFIPKPLTSAKDVECFPNPTKNYVN